MPYVRPTRTCLAPVLVLAALAGAAVPAAAQDGPPAPEPRPSCSGADVVPVDRATLQTARGALRCLVAAERTTADVAVLRPSAALGRAAQRHATDMRRRRYLDAVSPGGGTLADRLRRSRYAQGRRVRAAEILGFGVGDGASAAGILRAIEDSPEQRSRLLSTRYAHLGIGLSLGLPRRGDTRRGVTLSLLVASRR